MNYSLNEEIIERFFEGIKALILPSESNNYKSRLLQSDILLYCVVLLLVLKIITVAIPINFPQNIFFADITKSSLENFVNQTRQSIGLPALTKNQKLNRAARLKAENMAQEQYFNHTSPSGVSPWFWFLQAGYNYKYAGENLAIGFYESEEVYNAWLNSPSHRANIVNPNYTEIGTAVLSGYGGNNTIVVVQEFGTQLSVNQVPVEVQPNTTPKITEPVKTNNVETPVASTNKKVLSQSTSIQPPKVNGVNNLASRLMNSVLYDYDKLLQNIIYGVLLIIIGTLLTMIFINSNLNFNKALVSRLVLLVIILSLATLLNKELIVLFIPHQVII